MSGLESAPKLVQLDTARQSLNSSTWRLSITVFTMLFISSDNFVIFVKLVKKSCYAVNINETAFYCCSDVEVCIQGSCIARHLFNYIVKIKSCFELWKKCSIWNIWQTFPACTHLWNVVHVLSYLFIVSLAVNWLIWKPQCLACLHHQIRQIQNSLPLCISILDHIEPTRNQML